MTAQKSDKAPNLAVLQSLPLGKVSEALQDLVAPKLRISFASVVLDNMINRTWDQTRRGVADRAAAMHVLKQYEDMGGKL